MPRIVISHTAILYALPPCTSARCQKATVNSGGHQTEATGTVQMACHFGLSPRDGKSKIWAMVYGFRLASRTATGRSRPRYSRAYSERRQSEMDTLRTRSHWESRRIGRRIHDSDIPVLWSCSSLSMRTCQYDGALAMVERRHYSFMEVEWMGRVINIERKRLYCRPCRGFQM